VKLHAQTNLMDRGRTKLNEAPVIISKVLEPNEIPLWHDRCTRAGAILFWGGFDEDVGNWFINHHRLLGDLPRVHDGTSLV